MELRERFLRAAEALQRAEVLVITAGAGMGVDSGLPDFRGDSGFWKAYPPYERLGITFVGAANPAHFERDRPLAGDSTAIGPISTAPRSPTPGSESSGHGSNATVSTISW